MKNIKVKLLSSDTIENAFIGLRVCTDTLKMVNEDNYDKNIKLLKMSLEDEVPHLSILKHIIYHLLIEGIPRSLLQELVRHQVGVAINVLSTRWALHKIFKDPLLEKINQVKNPGDDNVFEDVESFVRKYYFISSELEEMKGNSDSAEIYKNWIIQRLHEVQEMKRLREERGYGNDKLKHLVNESLRTKVYITVSALALRNMFNQRLYKDSWYVFRYTASLIYKTLPEEHGILYNDIVEKRGLFNI